MTDSQTQHYHGHRERLRQKFLDHGGESLADYEMLELYLFKALPRRDVKPVAKDLIKKFGGFSEVLSAPFSELTSIRGIGKAAAFDLKLLQAASLRLSRASVMDRPVLGSWNAVLDYCRSAMQFEPREQFRCLFLDKKHRLIADEKMAEGTLDHTPVYPREIARRALELHAAALILAHNHPSGDPTPSGADVSMTNNIVDALRHLNITVHDHLVIGRNRITSFKKSGLL